MQEPRLTREVELPRQRSNGAAVVLVAAMAMFTAVAASAFVVRVRMNQERGPRAHEIAAEPIPAAFVSGERQIVEVEVVDVAEFYDAVARGDDEGALQAYLDYDTTQRARISADREAVARGYLSVQLYRLSDELDRGDCAAVSERLHRLSRLLPDKQIPEDMALCTETRWPGHR